MFYPENELNAYDGTKRYQLWGSGKWRWGWMLLSIFVLCSLIEPAYISQATTVGHQIYRVCKYLSVVIVLFLFLLRRRVNSFLAGVFIFELALLLPTILSGKLYAWLQDGAYVIALAILMQVVAERNASILLTAFSAVLGTYVHINTLCWFLYPNGMYVHAHGYWNCWFLGYDNTALPIIMLASVLAVFRLTACTNRGRLWDLSVLASGWIFVGGMKIATGIIVGIFFFSLVLLSGNRAIRRFLGKSKKILVLSMAAIFLIIHFIGLRGGLFQKIFLLLGKNSTFSGRTGLWQMAWNDLFRQGLLFGRGVSTADMYIRHFGLRWASHLHCYYLQVLYEGGIVTFCILFLLICHVVGRYDKTEKTHASIIFLIGLLSFLVAWQVEAYDAITRYFIIILSLVYNTPSLEKAGSQLERREKKVRIVFVKNLQGSIGCNPERK